MAQPWFLRWFLHQICRGVTSYEEATRFIWVLEAGTRYLPTDLPKWKQAEGLGEFPLAQSEIPIGEVENSLRPK